MENVRIKKSLFKDVPSDAILLSKEEVLNMHWRIIKEWNPSSDVWPFFYGVALLSASSASSSFNIVYHYRRKLKLGIYGRVTMVLPTVAFPTLVSLLGHVQFVANPMLLGEECPLCLETRAAAVQIMGGIVFPAVVSPIAGFYYAMRYATYDVPPINKENLKEVGQLWWKFVKGLRTRIVIPIIANAVVASVVTYFEAKSFYKCQQIIEERENQLRKLVGETEQSA